MPVYEYQARDAEEGAGCEACREPFEVVRKIADGPLETCPACGAPLRKLIPRVALGRSRSGLDDRAKAAGFTKLKKLGKGEYEKIY
ncbi:MAG: FmdB family zinc ribbon protein [Kiritimatiellia bacterium]|jgi:putative FmdB family regulatory protein